MPRSFAPLTLYAYIKVERETLPFQYDDATPCGVEMLGQSASDSCYTLPLMAGEVRAGFPSTRMRRLITYWAPPNT